MVERWWKEIKIRESLRYLGMKLMDRGLGVQGIVKVIKENRRQL
jgi:hypothetical protein